MTAANQSDVLRALQKAHGKLENVIRYLRPKGGMVLAYAADGARDCKGVAVAHEGSVGFGIDEEITRVILTVLRYDEDMRACGVVRYTDEIYEFVRELLLEVEKYDVQKYPKGISTMDWGVSFMCKKGVPMALASQNSSEREDCIFIFGTTPEEAANRILILSERLSI
ncbi:MAG TPA: hypothetical protein O0X39_01665 [Methanocorpusculum sp.]|nr:hypothetical protein [Methanocorpusculum sp.]